MQKDKSRPGSFIQSAWFPLRFVYLSACRSVTRLVSSAGPAVLPRSKTKERQIAAQDEGDLALSFSYIEARRSFDHLSRRFGHKG